MRDEAPVALATVTAVGPKTESEARDNTEEASAPPRPRTRLGAKLLVQPGGEAVLGTLGEPDLDRVVSRDVVAALDRGVTVTRHYGPRGEARQTRAIEVFIEVFAPPALLVIFGAVDFTASLASAGKLLGFRVIVCDARPVFATRARFPMADEVVVDWPDRYLATIAENPRAARCGLRSHPRHKVRRAGHHGRPPDAGRLPRRHGFTAHPRASGGGGCSRRGRPRRRWPSA